MSMHGIHAHSSSCLYMCGALYIRDVVRNTQTFVCMYPSVCLHDYMCAQLQVKSCLGADRRNPDRHGGAFIKGSMASVPPHRPLRVAQQA